MLTRFSHVMMYVSDLERAITWYCRHLGFVTRMVAPGHYASLHHAGIACRLDLHPSESQGRDVGFGPIPYFEVSELDEFLARLAADGVRTGVPRSEGGSPRFVTIWDSEGNALGLGEAERER